MYQDKDGRYHAGIVTFTPPNDLKIIDDSELNAVYCFSIENKEHDFSIRTEICYSRENAKAYLEAALDDDEIEPLGEITPFSVNGLSGYYLDCFFPMLESVRREFYFDIPDKEYNFFSVFILTNNEKNLRYALQSETIVNFFKTFQLEAKKRLGRF